MGSSDYHITILIDRRNMGLAAGDLDMFKAFFKVGVLGDGGRRHQMGTSRGSQRVHSWPPEDASHHFGTMRWFTIMIDLCLCMCLCTQTFAELYPMKLYRVGT